MFVLLTEVDSSQLRRQLCGGSQAAIERMIHFGRELQAMSEQLRRECGKNTANKKMLKVSFVFWKIIKEWNCSFVKHWAVLEVLVGILRHKLLPGLLPIWEWKCSMGLGSSALLGRTPDFKRKIWILSHFCHLSALCAHSQPS